jgi:aminoglycoside phosphotransferase (APT) family kinase protein
MDWQASLAEHLRALLPAAESVDVARAFRMGAGASNETIGLDLRVVSGGIAHVLPLVLRPERTHGILAPYDIASQFRVMRALQGTPVPVPAVAWYETTGAVIGAPFFVMYRMEGETLPVFWYGGHSPRLDAIAAALAQVHAVDWRTAGLEFLLPAGPGSLPPSPLEADLAGWRVRASHAGLQGHELVLALAGYLARNEPSDARLAFLHGDPNPGNYLLQGDEVVAVLDWELAAIGDPRADLGFYAALMVMFAGMAAPGSRTHLANAYEGVTGSPLRDLDYYEGVGLYKMAVVMSGWGGLSGFGYGLDAITRRLAQLFGPRWAG